MEIFDTDIIKQREGGRFGSVEMTWVLSCGIRQSNRDDRKNIHQSRGETELHITKRSEWRSLQVVSSSLANRDRRLRSAATQADGRRENDTVGKMWQYWPVRVGIIERGIEKKQVGGRRPFY